MEPTYYRLNLSKATYLECWRVGRSLFEFVVGCFVKTFRLSFLATYAVTNEGFKRLEWNELRADVQASLQLIRSEFETAGFRYCFCYCYPTLGSMQATEMVLRSDDGNSCASVKHERHQSGNFVNSVVTTTVVSELSNGTFLTTCDRQDVMPPEFLGERHPRYSASQLAQRHRERIAEASPAYPLPRRDDYDVEQRTIEIEQRVFRYYVERGLLVPLSTEQADRYKTQAESNNAAAPAPTAVGLPVSSLQGDADYFDLSDEHVFEAALAAGSSDAPISRYPGVIAELEKIRNKKGSSLSGAVILGISVALFVGFGAAQWEWEFVLLLIPILFFHEMGHFVAMRMFKYRNLKMFFIPLLGAAVTGQNYNVAGWKKAIVSLAGPVPGIFVGCLLGIVALVLGDQELLLKAAVLTVFLNAFNLLPFLPLDGGWIVHVLLFSRHHVLDAVFRSLAAVTLILSGLLGFKFLMFIGIIMLMGLRSAYRVARVTSEIRDAGIDTSSPDGQSIPIATADAIISRLDAAAPLPVPDTIKAQQTLQVFESVNARPPGVLGTLALAGVHGGSFVVAVVFGLVMAVAQHPDFAGLFGDGMTAPKYRYECGTAEQWPAAADRLPSGTASTVVATFSSIYQADETFSETKAELPEGAIVTRFGQSVMVTLDAESQHIDKLVAQFESAIAKVEIATPTDQLMITLDATLATSEQAEMLEQEALAYFSLPTDMAAIPPWDSDRKLTESQKTARRTYQELLKFRPYENERFKKLSRRMMESSQAKNQAKTQKLVQEQQALTRELQQEYNQQLLERDDLDKYVIEIYSRQPQMPDWGQFIIEGVDYEAELVGDEKEQVDQANAQMLAAQAQWTGERRAWHLEMGSLMGQLPLSGDSPTPSAYGIIGNGSVERTDATLRFWIHLHQPDDGALAVANWLCGYGCSEVKYVFGYDE